MAIIRALFSFAADDLTLCSLSLLLSTHSTLSRDLMPPTLTYNQRPRHSSPHPTRTSRFTVDLLSPPSVSPRARLRRLGQSSCVSEQTVEWDNAVSRLDQASIGVASERSAVHIADSQVACEATQYLLRHVRLH
ncbi:hypothetical protein DL93DRAFT_2090818 [Clavulina sp. PMI_390]|nr:hypothetical protein DL93DRAFT_2090818 [Clavulina sp. PMI_390]